MNCGGWDIPCRRRNEPHIGQLSVPARPGMIETVQQENAKIGPYNKVAWIERKRLLSKRMSQKTSELLC